MTFMSSLTCSVMWAQECLLFIKVTVLVSVGFSQATKSFAVAVLMQVKQTIVIKFNKLITFYAVPSMYFFL